MNKLKYTTNQLVYFASGQECYVRGYDVNGEGIVSYVVTIRDRCGLHNFETSMFEKETYTKEEWNKNIIMNEIVSKFMCSEEMIESIYEQVIELNKTTKNIYECLSIVETRIVDGEIKFYKLMREFLRRM